MAQMRIALEWAFDARLDHDKDRLIASLKPDVTAWATTILPRMRKQLRRAARRDGTEATMVTRTVEGMVGLRRVWMFNAMIANRDIGTDVIAMVAADEGAAHAMARGFLDAAEARMGPGTPVV